MAAARVLVVDDERLILEIVGRALRPKGYQVLDASSPHQALEVVGGRDAVDVVVSDVVMPEMSGPELVTEIRKRSPSTAVVLMSGYVEASEVPAGIPFLRKPFSPRELVRTVEQALEGAAKARQALGEACSESRKLRSERWQMCEDLEKTTRKSKARIRESKDRLDSDRKTPLE